MIVDDEEAARYGMRRALSTFGYNISEAGSAEAARALLKQHEPDLLLLDVNLPGMSGLDYDAAQDLGRVKLTKQTLTEPAEWFTIELAGNALNFAWDRTRASVPVVVR